MSTRDRVIHRILEKTLFSAGYDLLDLLSLPSSSDPIELTRSLEEMIQESEARNTDSDSSFYLVRVRAKQVSVDLGNEGQLKEPAVEQKMYLTDGSLNTQYLEQNAEILLLHGDYALARNVYQTILQSGQKAGQALYGIASCYEKKESLI